MNQQNLKKKDIKCPKCSSKLRTCKNGLICMKSHLFDKNSKEWLEIEAIVTDRPIVSNSESDSYSDDGIPAGFMLRSRKLEYK